jgi:V/A-type H+-transporting ATPase subunit A
VTIGGTVSPAGGNFEEPVTQATLKVVGSFHGLSRERSDARKYPAIHPLDSWSQYRGIIPEEKVGYALRILARGAEVEQMMKVVGEEGTSLEDYIVNLKGDFLDAAYLQQNSFDKVDQAASPERQRHVFDVMLLVLGSQFHCAGKEEARAWFSELRQKFIDYNYAPWQDAAFRDIESEIRGRVQEKSNGLDREAESLITR